MSNLALRLLTAALLIPLLVLAILWHNPLGVWLWVFLAQVAGLREWLGMTLPPGDPGRWFGLGLGTVVALVLYWLPGPHTFLFTLCGAVMASALFFLVRPGPIETVAARMNALWAGLLYTVVLILPLALLKQRPDGWAWIYICLTVSWLSDTFAYFAGRFLGPLWPRKLYPAVSPKKTVIGALGGLFGGVLSLVIAKLGYLP